MLYYIIKNFYWGSDGFCVTVLAGASSNILSEFTLTFDSPASSRTNFRTSLAATANIMWSAGITEEEIRAIDPTKQDPPEDVSGRPIVTLSSSTSAGLPNITVQDVPDNCASYRRSWLIECPPNVITLRDLCISNDLLGQTNICLVASSSFACATEATLGSELQIDLIDRDDVLGYFPYIGASRCKLPNITNISGTFQVGEEIRGATCRSRVLGVGADYLEISFDRWNSVGKMDSFSANEVVTGHTSGATATLSNQPFTEGGFLFLQRFIMDEALYGFKSHEQKPGGAKQVPPGMYFRCAVWNSDASQTLWIDGSINIGKM